MLGGVKGTSTDSFGMCGTQFAVEEASWPLYVPHLCPVRASDLGPGVQRDGSGAEAEDGPGPIEGFGGGAGEV